MLSRMSAGRIAEIVGHGHPGVLRQPPSKVECDVIGSSAGDIGEARLRTSWARRTDWCRRPVTAARRRQGCPRRWPDRRRGSSPWTAARRGACRSECAAKNPAPRPYPIVHSCTVGGVDEMPPLS